MKPDLKKLCLKAAEAARNTGAFLASEHGKVSDQSIEDKGHNALVSYVDKQAEAQLVETLSELLPEAAFLTEEDTVENSDGVWRWIIDPLDGTTNFLHELPCFAVSIGLEYAGKLVAGIVYEVNQNECFYAWEGGGAWCNKRPIKVSQRQPVANALLATGFPYYNFEWMQAYLSVAETFMRTSRGLRRWGSAAVDLAYVASGRYDAFFEYSLQPWDVAGGLVLVQEAGGRITDFFGGQDYPSGSSLIASNGLIHEELLSVIKPHFESV